MLSAAYFQMVPQKSVLGEVCTMLKNGKSGRRMYVFLVQLFQHFFKIEIFKNKSELKDWSISRTSSNDFEMEK